MKNILFSWLIWVLVTLISGVLIAIGRRGRFNGYLAMPSAIMAGAYIIFTFYWAAECVPIILTVSKGGFFLWMGFIILSMVGLYLAYCVGKKILLRHYRRKLGWK